MSDATLTDPMTPPAPTLRWVLGPQFGYDAAPELPPAAPSTPVKRDLVVSYGGIRSGQVLINVPSYDPAEVNTLVKLRVYATLNGQPLIPTADGLLASPTPFGEADAVIGQTSVPLPDVPRADAAGNGLKYTVQVLLGFAT